MVPQQPCTFSCRPHKSKALSIADLSLGGTHVDPPTEQKTLETWEELLLGHFSFSSLSIRKTFVRQFLIASWVLMSMQLFTSLSSGYSCRVQNSLPEARHWLSTKGCPVIHAADIWAFCFFVSLRRRHRELTLCQLLLSKLFESKKWLTVCILSDLSTLP